MPERWSKNLQAVVLIIGVTTGVFGAVQSMAVIPYRLKEVETKVQMLESVVNRVDKELVGLSVSNQNIEKMVTEMRQLMTSQKAH